MLEDSVEFRPPADVEPWDGEEEDITRGSSNRVLDFCNSLYSLVMSVAATSEMYFAYAHLK